MNFGLLRKPFTLGLLMLIAAGLTIAATPKKRLADESPKIDLEMMIPREFGEWRIDPTIIPIQVSPDVRARLDKIYTQTLARTYVGPGGHRVMLSIAYGSDQRSEATQVHRPEFCYSSQGFQVVRSAVTDMVTGFGTLPVRRLVATQGRRYEPITYWITVGERATLPGIGRKLSQIAYGMLGTVPDGMLVRVSSIDPSETNAYQNQDRFIRDLLSSVEPHYRQRLVGVLG